MLKSQDGAVWTAVTGVVARLTPSFLKKRLS